MREPPDLPPLELVDGIAVEALPAALAHLLALQARVVARLAAGKAVASVVSARLLSVDEAAARTGMSKDWLYRHAKTLPFTRRLGRAVRFDEAALTRWLATRGR